MQKQHTILLFLLVATSTFAQKAVQHAAYVGIDVPYLTMNYDARFRNPDRKVDFAVGGGLTVLSNAGLTAHGSTLFGKGANSFEVGLNSFYGNAEDGTYGIYTNNSRYAIRRIVTEFRPFIGYRLQPKNKHFILQIQHTPYIFGTRTEQYLWGNTSKITQIAASPYIGKDYNGSNRVDWYSHFALHLGCNINTVKAENTENTAYEAPENGKIGLEHTAAAFIRTAGGYGLVYDLRMRRPQGVDFALNLGYGLTNYSNSQNYEALALFFKGKANLEAGIGVHSLKFSYYYPTNVFINMTTIGTPLGFRYQTRHHVFVRSYMMPYMTLYNSYNTDTYYKAFGFIDGVTWGLNVGYTF